MKHILIKMTIFIVVFFLSLFISSALLNKGNTDMTAEMEKASLPVVTMGVGGMEVNTLYGYTRDMQEKYLRETLTPFGEDKTFSLHITHASDLVSAISFEVRSAGSDRLVEKTEILDYTMDGEEIRADFGIKDLVDPDLEYLLVISLSLKDGRTAQYYTRIADMSSADVEGQLAFVKDFHDKTFKKDEAGSLAKYLESNEEGDNSTYRLVNIHSSLSQVTWGNLSITHVEEPRFQIYDMDGSLSSMALLYEVYLAGRDRDEKYCVREFFRIRYTPDRVYLLDYDRTMNQIFDPQGPVFANDKIVLGITGDDVALTENTEGTAVVFTQYDALYEYRNGDGQLARLFSFYDDDNADIRCLNDRHEVKTLSVDENGNAYFMVYGYMNRGAHEGQVGVSVYYYDNPANYIEEKLYIPYTRSWEMLREEVERLSYINRNSTFFICLENTLYSFDLEGGDERILMGELRMDRFVSSQSCRMVAWLNDEENRIELMDLNSSSTRIIDAMDQERLALIGFMGDNIVYGVANNKDMVRDRSGLVTMPMHTIKIENMSGQALKTYYRDNVYVIGTSISNMTLHLKRVRKKENNGSYTYRMIADDQIMDNRQESVTKNSLMQVVTQTKETVTQIALMVNVSGSIKFQTPKEVITEGKGEAQLSETSHAGEYYVYGKGGFVGTYPKPYEAVNSAAQMGGTVLDDDQNYIWQRGNRQDRCELVDVKFASDTEQPGISHLAMCLGAMLRRSITDEELQGYLNNGDTAISILREHSGARVLDLSGCELSAVLYYVSSGHPVLASTGGSDVVLIVGYDEKNTILLDPSTMTRHKLGMNDSKELFEEGRNGFIVMY